MEKQKSPKKLKQISYRRVQDMIQPNSYKISKNDKQSHLNIYNYHTSFDKKNYELLYKLFLLTCWWNQYFARTIIPGKGLAWKGVFAFSAKSTTKVCLLLLQPGLFSSLETNPSPKCCTFSDFFKKNQRQRKEPDESS